MNTKPLSHFTLVPAYGRDYKTAKEAKDAFLNRKDWKIYGGPYCSVEDAQPGEMIKLRFNQLRDVIFVTVPEKPHG